MIHCTAPTYDDIAQRLARMAGHAATASGRKGGGKLSIASFSPAERFSPNDG